MNVYINRVREWIWSSTILRRAAKLIYWTFTLQLPQKIKERLKARHKYQMWIEQNEPTQSALKEMHEVQAHWPYRPKISLITPVFRPRLKELKQCIESVSDQIYDNWELCLTFEEGEEEPVRQAIQQYAKRDERIKISQIAQNEGIADNSNESLKISSGEYVGLLDQDDLLAPFALFEVVKTLNADSTIDFIYSDEDKIDKEGVTRSAPHFKPTWSPDTLLSHNYICHFVVMRKSIVDEIGGFRAEYEGSQDYDLFLRASLRTQNIHRIPKVLYHWRAGAYSVATHPSSKVFAYDSAQKAIESFLAQKKIDAEIRVEKRLFTFRAKYRVQPGQRVTIIVPTKDKAQYLKRCISSIQKKTDFENYEIFVVDNGSREWKTLEYYSTLEHLSNVRVLEYGGGPFNFSAINNFAASRSTSDQLLFLNNDTEVISSEWISAMLEFSQRRDVGAVGAKLLYPDLRVQHAGVILGIGGVAGHSHKGIHSSSSGYAYRINIIQNLSAVTGACMMMRREIFEEVNGFDEELAISFNDVDLCMKIRERGYLIVYTPYAELIHHESTSRGYDTTPERKERFAHEVAVMKKKWDFSLPDPYYSPNLTLEREDFGIRVENQ